MRLDTHDLRVSGLSAQQARSLAATLSTAAIAVEIDAAHGTLLVPRSRNAMFDLAKIESVIHEWAEEDERRNPSVTLTRPHDARRAAAGTTFGRLRKLDWLVRAPR
ncbi:MAG TPA: hypothetical protein VIQ78_05410 [Terrimesophilobacter sp.]|jgi:hypothetical protein|uniref:hypothetical protein n=1 Tax=Terrimesophilobacter sp. TaxID=2906435 RepID=UPI002F922239